MYQKYLVTGAKDPVGRLVVQMLLAEGCSVRVLVPPESDYSLLRGMGAEIAEGEIFDRDSLKEFLAVDDPRHSAVIHTEEIVNISNNKNMDMRRTNVAGAQNIIDMAMRAKVGRFVYLGSAYSIDPDSVLSGEKVHFDRKKVDGDYAATKAEASAYLMEKISVNKFNASLLLPTFIIGPGFSEDYDMNKILKKYLENKVSTISGGHAFVDVRNVATALVAVCENGEPGGAYILNGEYKSSKEFFSEVSEASGSERVKEMPKWQQSKSMGKFVDTFYRITKKDNPKEVYALFMNSPEANYESTVDGILPESEVRKVHDSLVDVLQRPGNEVLPDRIDLEKAAEAAEAAKERAAAAPKEEKPAAEVKTVSEAVIKRAEESNAKAREAGEDAEKRAAAAAAARERVRAKIEAAKLKAEQREELAESTAKANEMAADSVVKAAPDEAKKEEPKEEESSSFMPRLSVAEMMAQAEAKKKEDKAKAEAKKAEDEAAKAEEEAEPANNEEGTEVTTAEAEEAADEVTTVEEAAPAEEATAAVPEVEEKAEEAVKEAVSPKADFEEESEAAALEEFAEFAPDVELTAAAPETFSETEPEPEVPAAEPAPEAESEPEVAAESEPEADVGTEPEPEAEPEAESELAAEPEADAEAEPEAETEAPAAEPEATAEAEEKPAEPDNSNKPLWERISADDITEEEIFGSDDF